MILIARRFIDHEVSPTVGHNVFFVFRIDGVYLPQSRVLVESWRYEELRKS